MIGQPCPRSGWIIRGEPAQGRGFRPIRVVEGPLEVGLAEGRSCRRLADLPHPLLGWGAIRGEAGQGEKL